MANKAPGKLKFNPAMFNPAAMKPGAKNPLLAKKKAEAAAKRDEVKPLQNADFEKPQRPRRGRRINSRPIIDLELEAKEAQELENDRLSRSIVASGPLPELTSPNAPSSSNPTEPDPIVSNDAPTEPAEASEAASPQTQSVLSPLSPNVKQLSNDLSSKFENRKSVVEMKQSGLIDPTIASSLAETKHILEQKQKAQQLQERVNARPEPEDMVDQGHLLNDPRKLDGKLHETASQLEKGLEDRSDRDYLSHTNVLKRTNMADSLQPNAQNVEDKLSSRQPRDTLTAVKSEFQATAEQVDRLKKEHNVKTQLSGRPEKMELRQSGLIKSDAAASIQGTMGQLDKALKTDAVKKGLTDRSSTSELTEHGIVKSQAVAPALQSASVALERNMKTDHVSKDMKDRHTQEDLQKHNIVKNGGVADSLAGTATALEMNIKTDHVSKETKERHTKEELQSQRILKPGNLANSLQGAATDLEYSLKSDSVSKQVAGRSEKSDLEQKGVVKNSNVAASLASSASDLERNLISDKVSTKLKGQMSVDEMVKQGALKDTDLAPALQGAAVDLEQKMKGNKVKAQLSTRQDEDTLRKRGVLTPNSQKMAPQFAGAAVDLDKSLKKDAVSRGMKDRRTTEELVQSGIMQHPEDVEQLENREDDFELDKGKDVKDNRLRMKKFLNRRLSKEMRPTPETMALYNIIPDGTYFQDPTGTVKARKARNKEAQKKLSLKYSSRSKPDELVARGLAYEKFWEDEAHNVERERKARLQLAKESVAEKLNPKRRPSVIDLATHHIYPEDSEVVQELKEIAKKHHRMQSAVDDLATKLPFEQRVAEITASNMMRHLAETEDDVMLCDDDECANPRHFHKKKGDGAARRDSTENPESGSSTESVDEVAQQERVQRRRRLSMSLARGLERRSTQDQLEDQGIIKHGNIASSLRGAAVELDELMGDRLPKYVLQHHKILKRPSIARSLQPQAEQLETELLELIRKGREMEFEQVPEEEDPLYRSSDGSEASPRRGSFRTRQRRASSAFGSLKGRNPTWYKHDIAHSLQDTANRLHKQRLSITLNQKFASRPSKQELLDNRILYNPVLARGLQDKAYLLERLLKMQVPEKYLAKIGVLQHTGDAMAPSIQPTAADLENLLQRRPSLYEAMTQDMKKLLSDYERNNPDMLPISETPNSTNNNNEDAAFDRRTKRAQRKQIGKVINRRLSLRMSREELVERGLVPEDYWDDPNHAYFMKGVNRKLFAEDLKRGIKNRSRPEEIYARGITRREWLEMDYDKAQQVVAKKIQYQRSNLKTKLHEHWGLGMVAAFEDQKILEPGYMENVVEDVRVGHRRAGSVVKEISEKLMQNPEYNEILAKGLVTDLQPDATEFEDESSDDDTYSDDDEEQHQRLLDLEYRIGHRPSMAELVDQRILHYHHVPDGGNKGVAPRIQSSAVGLQNALGRRMSLEDMSRKGMFTTEDYEIFGLSKEQVLDLKARQEAEAAAAADKSREERAANASEVDKLRKKKKRPNKVERERKEELDKKLDRRRRPTMMDLELRGIVPEGYFKNVEMALQKRSIRRNSVVNDLSTRLRDRPELSDLIARKILEKALKAADKRDELIKKQTQKENVMVKALLEKKLQLGRPSVADLQQRNIVRSGYDPRTTHAQVNQRAVELESQSKRKRLEESMNARPTQDEMLDNKYLKHRVGGEGHVLAHSLHEVATDLDVALKHRIARDALKKDDILYEKELDYNKAQVAKKLDPRFRPDFNDMLGRGMIRAEYYDPEVEQDQQQEREQQALNKIKLRLEDMVGSNRRPTPADLQDAHIVPHGAYEDVDAAMRNKHDRMVSLQNEVDRSLAQRPGQEQLVQNGVLRVSDTLDSQSRAMQAQHQLDAQDQGATPPPSRGDRNLKRDSIDRGVPHGAGRGGTNMGRNYSSQSQQSPEIPPLGVAETRAQAAKEQVMNALTSQNRMVLEPLYQVDVLVAEPELKDNEIYSSQLAFMNVLDALERIIQGKMQEAKSGHIDVMTQKAADLSTLKNLLRKLQAFGPTVIDTIDRDPEFENVDFKSSGDLDRDIENVSKHVWGVQKELYDLDESYFPLHKKIRQLQSVRDEMTKYYDQYRMRLSQMKRVERRIQSYITENRTNKESSQEAIKATSERQGLMLSKITNKIAETHLKIDRINYEISKFSGVTGIGSSAQRAELTEELTTCKNFLTGLMEFKKGLKRLRTEQQSRIKHLEQVVNQLIKQRAAVSEQLSDIRSEAIEKLDEVRKLYIIPLTLEQEQNEAKARKAGHEERSATLSQTSSASSGILGSILDDDMDPENDYDNLAPLSMMELMHKREKYMNKVFKKIHDLESRALTTSSSDYLRGLTEIRELQIILSNSNLKYFYNQFVNKCNEIFHDCVLASAALFEKSARWDAPILQDMSGVKLLKDIIRKNGKFDERHHQKYLDTIQNFISSLPDKEVVIMQVGRHIATSLPFRSEILDEEKEKYHTKMRHQRLYSKRPYGEEPETENQATRIQDFVMARIRELMASILDIYGNNTFNSVRAAVDNDVVAQVRPSRAAKIIVNCVYGLDVSL